MGTAMATRLLNAGHSLAVWNRSADKCEALVALGARRVGPVGEGGVESWGNRKRIVCEGRTRVCKVG